MKRRLARSIGILIGGLALAVLLRGDSPAAAAMAAPLPLNTNAATDAGSDLGESLAGDGQGNWVAIWMGRDGPFGSDDDIIVARSSDDAATWTSPAALALYAGSDNAEDVYPQVATDGAGAWIAVWTSTHTLGGTIGADYDILFTRSTDNGATWTYPSALNTNAGTDNNYDLRPQIATDENGTWLVAWQTQGMFGSDNDNVVSRSTNGGVSWSAPALIDVDGATDIHYEGQPSLGADSTGTFVFAYYGRLGKISVTRSLDGGITWDPETALTPSQSYYDRYPDVTGDGLGNWVMVWESHYTSIHMSRSTDNAQTWSAPTSIGAGTSTPNATTPSTVVDASGNWIAIWQEQAHVFIPESGHTTLTSTGATVATSSDQGATWTNEGAVLLDYNPHVWTAGATLLISASNEHLPYYDDFDLDYQACSPMVDVDCDKAPDASDLCPNSADINQADLDGDGTPNSCDPDADNDQCLNTKELGNDETEGGDRDPLNRWDYFNPSHDGLNRVDDILLAVDNYYKDDVDGIPGQPPYSAGYDPDTDRTFVGPNGWNLGPPNGLQRVDDILNIVKQYYHDCS